MRSEVHAERAGRGHGVIETVGIDCSANGQQPLLVNMTMMSQSFWLCPTRSRERVGAQPRVGEWPESQPAVSWGVAEQRKTRQGHLSEVGVRVT